MQTMTAKGLSSITGDLPSRSWRRWSRAISRGARAGWRSGVRFFPQFASFGGGLTGGPTGRFGRWFSSCYSECTGKVLSWHCFVERGLGDVQPRQVSGIHRAC